MVVFVDYLVEQFGIMVLLHPEGFFHEGRIDAILSSDLFQFLQSLVVNFLIVDFLDIRQESEGILPPSLEIFVLDFVNCGQIWKLDIHSLLFVFFHELSSPLLLLPLSPLLLLLQLLLFLQALPFSLFFLKLGVLILEK